MFYLFIYVNRVLKYSLFDYLLEYILCNTVSNKSQINTKSHKFFLFSTQNLKYMKLQY